VIDHGFLSDLGGHDVDVLCDGIGIVHELTRDELGGLLGEELPPTGTHTERSAMAAAVRSHCVHYWHPVGTCAMGLASDSGAVVGARGRVHGLENVYVADASVMPTSPRANTNLPTLLVAHRVAAAIACDGRT
jgi:choline dehydrogenase-like flavoprotein